MVRTKQTQRMSTGGKAPRRERQSTDRSWQTARMSTGGLSKEGKKAKKAREIRVIAYRYTAEARDRRAVRRSEEARKREDEKAAKETE